MDCAILFGSRALGVWDDQSDLDTIVIHQAAGDDAQEPSLAGLAINQLRQLHYPGYLAYESPHHEVMNGLMLETPDNYRAHRRTQNHVMARAAREGLVFCKEPGNEHRYRHDGDVSNEWELVTKERLRRAANENRILADIPRFWPPHPVDRHNVNTVHGRNAHGLLRNSGAALLSILGAIYPRDSVAEMARSIAQHDAGWSHLFQSDLDHIDQYSDCGCEVVVTDPINDVPINDVPAMRQDLQVDRDALWERIRDLTGYDLTFDPAGAPSTS